MQLFTRWNHNVGWILPLFALAACAGGKPAAPAAGDATPAPGSPEQLALGRQLVMNHDCGGCHGGGSDPAAKGWLAGVTKPDMEWYIGACTVPQPKAKPCFITRPRNLTPDNATGLGRFTERQIFNALRFGLRPEDTPDVDITGTTPGQSNFPATPHYLAPPMPWPGWRYMSDQELLAIAVYLKRGVAPVSNKVAESEGPPDFWASAYTAEAIGPNPPRPFPTANEHQP